MKRQHSPADASGDREEAKRKAANEEPFRPDAEDGGENKDSENDAIAAEIAQLLESVKTLTKAREYQTVDYANSSDNLVFHEHPQAAANAVQHMCMHSHVHPQDIATATADIDEQPQQPLVTAQPNPQPQPQTGPWAGNAVTPQQTRTKRDAYNHLVRGPRGGKNRDA